MNYIQVSLFKVRLGFSINNWTEYFEHSSFKEWKKNIISTTSWSLMTAQTEKPETAAAADGARSKVYLISDNFGTEPTI